MSIDYEKLLSVQDELYETVEKSMRSVALSFFRNVTFASPYDIGTFRANWVVGIDFPDNNPYPRRFNLNSATARANAEIKKFEYTGNQVIYINNNLPYARRLNNGYAKNAPKFFVEIAAQRAGINIKDGDL